MDADTAAIDAALKLRPVSHTAGGPMKALNRLVERLPTDRERALWLLEAEKASIIGSCPKSKSSVRSSLLAHMARPGLCISRS